MWPVAMLQVLDAATKCFDKMVGAVLISPDEDYRNDGVSDLVGSLGLGV